MNRFSFVLRFSALTLCLFVTFGCGRPGDVSNVATTKASNATPGAAIQCVPIGESSSSSGPTMFESMSAEACGITFVPEWKPRDQAEALLLKTGFTGGGVCIGDYDNDGLPDVYLTRPHGGGRLYRNLGDFKFEDVTVAAQVERSDDWPTGAAFCDLNNDSQLDLVVACLKTSNRLFLNQGDGTFKDVSASSGFNFVGASIKPIFADYDGDGDLDAYLVTNRLEPETPVKIEYTGTKGAYGVAEKHQELAMVINLPSGEQKFAKAGQFDRLYRNDLSADGTLKFTDVTKEAGLTGNFHGLDGCWWDADNDGDADLYVTNDFTDPDQFYRNNGDGTFTDVTGESLPCTPWFAMGCDAGDLNNDGRLDLLAADMAGTSHYRQKMAMGSMDAVAWFLDTAEPRQYMRNSLFVNTGTPRFQEAAQLAGLASSDWTWSVKIADFDNDGREDVFFTNGFTRDYLNSDFNNKLKQAEPGKKPLAWYDAPRLEEQNHAFRNEGNLHFTEASKSWGLDHVGISFGAAVADLDNDGDLDIVVNNFESTPSIYRNRLASKNRCKIKLVGEVSNRQAIGTSVEIKTKSGKQLRYHNPSGGYLSCDESLVHFGLGDDTTIEEMVVCWPSGNRQIYKDVAANQLVTVFEAKETEPAISSSEQLLFTQTNWLNNATHRETSYDDFAKQPLLPNKMSQLGPGLAIGDVNGDGLKDVFLGGASGQVGQLFIQLSTREFEPVRLECLEIHRGSEDMGCVLLDVDGDQDLDLFVVSGGVESDSNAVAYRDRLYINHSNSDGVRFEHEADAVPDNRDSGGAVSAADFDQDGDLDLFVGGRVVPGQYPTEPKSRLLCNESGVFVDASDAMTTELGMVTSSLWSDVDNDGWLDLLVTNDYGPIRVLRNQNGKLSDISADLQTAKLLGWWNSIMGCDVDLDGDIDYIVGNLGTNTKYHPTEEKPQFLFYGNFDGGSENRIVEAKSSAHGLLPTRGRSCSCNAMPFLEQKFESFHGFASASLSEIYSDSLLEKAHRVAATITKSGVLINTTSESGQRVLEFRPLSIDVQMAPVFGIAVMHANDDAYPDLFLAQNFFTPQRETGRMNGGLSCVLHGRGDGSFVAISADQTGIVIPEDAKSAVATDLDGDGRTDLIVATNNGRVRTYSMTNKFEPSQKGAQTSEKIEKYLGAGYLSSDFSP